MMPHFGEHLRSPLWAVGIKRGSRQDAGETVVQVYVTYVTCASMVPSQRRLFVQDPHV